jgi:hypothetical protein
LGRADEPERRELMALNDRQGMRLKQCQCRLIVIATSTWRPDGTGWRSGKMPQRQRLQVEMVHVGRAQKGHATVVGACPPVGQRHGLWIQDPEALPWDPATARQEV